MTAKELLKRIADGDKDAIAENKAAFVGVCAFCGVEFDKRRPDNKYCGKACRIAKHWREKKDIGVCAGCGSSFKKKRSRQKYCNKSCWLMNWHKKKEDQPA